MHGDFQVNARREGDCELLAVAGELDLASGPALEAALARVSPDETRRVVLDLRRLEFMDSTGLSIIVRAHRRLAEAGCELALVHGPEQVRRLLDLTGVADRVRLADGPEELLRGE